MFNINSILKNLEGKFPPEVISEAVQGLVKKGIMEQYTEEDGNFSFQLTEFGVECAEEIFKDPMSLLDFDSLDDEDGDGDS
tara:strand:+ start:152 stop:394 length:243 start_codon:yes stop_codon:yes gene_type:complete